MSSFDEAVNVVLANEGHYTNNPTDPGGATNYGISLRYLKDIGSIGDFDHDGDVSVDDIKKMTVIEARNLYKKYWWDKYRFDRIVKQSIATKLFDIAINTGVPQAVKLIQRSMWPIYGYRSILDDGILGDITVQKINAAPDDILMASFRSSIAGFYRELVAGNKSLSQFLNGWLNRTYS